MSSIINQLLRARHNVITEFPNNTNEDNSRRLIQNNAVPNGQNGTVEIPNNTTIEEHDDQSQITSKSKQDSESIIIVKAEGSSLFKCFYCNDCFSGNLERVNHIDEEHPEKPHYPDEDAFNNRMER